jgi:hypothetical protein
LPCTVTCAWPMPQMFVTASPTSAMLISSGSFDPHAATRAFAANAL